MIEETKPPTPAELLAAMQGKVVRGPVPETFSASDHDWKRLQARRAQGAVRDAVSEKHALALQEARDHIESLKAQIGMMTEIIDRLTAEEEEESDPKKRCL